MRVDIFLANEKNFFFVASLLKKKFFHFAKKDAYQHIF